MGCPQWKIFKLQKNILSRHIFISTLYCYKLLLLQQQIANVHKDITIWVETYEVPYEVPTLYKQPLTLDLHNDSTGPSHGFDIHPSTA